MQPIQRLRSAVAAHNGARHLTLDDQNASAEIAVRKVTKEEVEEMKRHVDAAVFRLYTNFPFWAYLIERCNIYASFSIPTACVTPDAKIYFNPLYFETLTREERMFVMAHEVAHLAFNHFGRQQHRDQQQWNRAADYLVNFIIAKEMTEQAMPRGLYYSPNVGDLTSEQVYDMLDLLPPPPSGGSGKEDEQSGDDGQEGQGGQSQQDQQKGGQQKGGQQKKQGPPNPDNAQGKRLKDENPNAWKDLQRNNEQSQHGGDEGDMRRVELEDGIDEGGLLRRGGDRPGEGESYTNWDEAVSAAANRAKAAGKLPGHLEKEVENFLKPKVHWTKEFAAAMNKAMSRDYRHDYSFMHPSRRSQIYGDVILPSLVGAKGRAVFALDTSGSMYMPCRGVNGEETTYLEQGISEIEAVRKQHNVEIYLMNNDADVHRGEWIQPHDPLPSLRGGGGTDFRPIFKHIEKEKLDPDWACIVTDAEGCFPSEEPPYEVIWIVFGKITPPFGTVVNILD